jgi:hypothetical protein
MKKVTLKKIKDSEMTKHNDSIEFMVYEDGEYMGNVSVRKISHHSAKEKGYVATCGGAATRTSAYEDVDSALQAGINKLFDRLESFRIEDEAMLEVLNG